MESTLDFKRDFGIEHDALDIEWLKHPQTYMKWAEALAEAEQTVREKEEQLSRIDASIDNETRIENEGKEKRVTADFVKAKIAGDERHINSTIELNDAIYTAKRCSNAVKALEQKRAALENLVRLWAGQYFSGPKEPRDLKNKLDMDGMATERIRTRMRNHN